MAAKAGQGKEPDHSAEYQRVFLSGTQMNTFYQKIILEQRVTFGYFFGNETFAPNTARHSGAGPRADPRRTRAGPAPDPRRNAYSYIDFIA